MILREGAVSAERLQEILGDVQLRSSAPVATIRIGISGWSYAGWRGDFYPHGLPQRRELEYAAERFSSIEINGSFYSLQRPSSYRALARADARRTSCSRSRAAGSSPT